MMPTPKAFNSVWAVHITILVTLAAFCLVILVYASIYYKMPHIVTLVKFALVSISVFFVYDCLVRLFHVCVYVRCLCGRLLIQRLSLFVLLQVS